MYYFNDFIIVQMAYNFRARTIRDALLEEIGDNEAVGGNASESEEEPLSEMSEGSEYEVSDSDDAMEVEDATINKRIVESRARGRPQTKLRGKNGYVWTQKPRERTSGMLKKLPKLSYPFF